MSKKRIIAHFMHSHELAFARAQMEVLAETDSYVLGNIDEKDVDGLSRHGLLVQDLIVPPQQDEETAPPFIAASRSKALSVMRERMSLDIPTLDWNRPQYYLVWLYGPLIEEWRIQLNELRVFLSETLPNKAYKTLLTPELFDRVAMLWFVARVRPLTALDAVPEIVSPLSDGDESTEPCGIKMLTMDILLHRAEDASVIRKWLEDRKVSIAGASGRKIRAYLMEDSQEMLQLAALTEVEKLEEHVPPELHNDRARVLMKLDLPSNVSYQQTGVGQIVGVADTGIDDSHPDFKGRIVGRVGLGRPGVSDDPNGHGTHVAGSIAGDGAASYGAYRGVAPGASIYFQSLLDSKGKLGGLPLDLKTLFEDAYHNGARIHNNSWGAATSSRYTFNAGEADEFVAQKRDMLIVISAGNEGSARAPRNNSAAGHVDWLSVGSPASCKNALTVGASRSDRTSGGYSGLRYGSAWPQDFPDQPIADEQVSGNPECLAAFSSRGPIDDRRIKPDVVAPGTDIVSAKSSLAPYSKFWGPVPNTSKYAYMGGTSMSAPLVSGCAALVREYLGTSLQYATPSAALVKAVLVNGARWLTGWDSIAPANGTPNYHQGFGCIDMGNTLPNAARPNLLLRYVDNWQTQSTQLSRTGQRRQFCLKVDEPCTELRICLVYSDLPGRALQNNLNLLVEVPGGVKVMGNAQLANKLILPDPDNNVEIIRIPNPTPGRYLIQVSATNLLKGPQDFALVATGESISELQPL
jgi:subtilisin family serine protease